MSASLYADYLTNRTNDHIMEHGFGFATYRFIEPATVYIIDIYVVPEQRKLGLASALADKIVDIAKTHGCTKLLGSVVPSSKGSTDSICVLLAYGMILDCSAVDLILFRKDI